MVRFLDEQDERARRGRRPSPTRSHHSSRDRDYSPDFISGPGRAPRPYASGAIPSTATAHQAPPPVPSPPLSPPISYRTGGGPGLGGYVYDDGRDRGRDRNGTPLRGRDRSWERSSGTGTGPHVAARAISVSRSRSRSRGPTLASTPAATPGTRERHIVRETKIYGGPELRDPERAVQALAVSDARRARSPSRDSRVSRDLSRSRSRGARSIYTTDDESDYPRSRGVSHSRRRSPSSRSRSRRSPSPAPLRKAKDLYSSTTFSPSTAALGVGVLGAIVGGLAAREATEHARKSHNGKKSHDGHSSSSRSRKEEEERERKAALISTIVGAAVGGLGANVIEKKFEEKKRVGEEEKRARERGAYRALRDRDRDLDDGYDRDRRSRSRHGRGSSLDTPAYSDDEGYYGSTGSAYGAGARRGGGTTTTVRGGR